MKRIELLAPARDYGVLRAAVEYGADAVYMGGPKFGARHAAGNSVEDIARGVEYAHIYGVRVYAALNTVLFDSELEQAHRQAEGVIAAGVDALIVQDMAYLEMGLGGVEFHASTQTFNASPGKVKFLQEAGFSRVILERNLTFEQIKEIRRATDVELELFVHGAICVCHSGRCYMSRTMSRRSGNRGECSQPCRLTYDLLDGERNLLVGGKHLLSVQDLDLSERVGMLIDAGITSFKIEGRLKDEGYVKNTVAYYRRRIDSELTRRPEPVRTSAGVSEYDFEPDLSKTFTRGRSEYFFAGKRRGVASPDTPKAMGEYIGKVAASGRGWFELAGGRFAKDRFADGGDGEYRLDGSVSPLANGDGICFLRGCLNFATEGILGSGREDFPHGEGGIGVPTASEPDEKGSESEAKRPRAVNSKQPLRGGELEGVNVNRVEGSKIFVGKELVLPVGTEIYRNYDHRFSTMLAASRTRRRIDARAELNISAGMARLSFTDEDGISAEASVEAVFDVATDPARALENLRGQISKSGDTVFRVRKVDITTDGDVPFIPAAAINRLRREALEQLLGQRLRLMPHKNVAGMNDNHRYDVAGCEKRKEAEHSSEKSAVGECGSANGSPLLSGSAVDGYENVTNHLAAAFYRRHGAGDVSSGLDTLNSLHGLTVMRTPYCIRRETGLCLKTTTVRKADKGSVVESKSAPKSVANPIATTKLSPKLGLDSLSTEGDMFLRRGTHLYRLHFDCPECMMEVVFE